MKVKNNKAVQCAGVTLSVMASYIIARLTGLENNGMGIYRIIVLGLMVIGTVVIFRRFVCAFSVEKTEQKQIVRLILVMGIAMRITYMLYTPCNVRSHDLWELDTKAYGHASYILNIMKNGQLPQNNFIQFYQQPLFYLFGSAASWIINFILGTFDNYSLVDAAKTVSCSASCISLMAAESIFEECGLEGKGLYRALIIVAFLPAYFLAGGMVGPDSLACMFMVLALLYTVKWIKCKSWKNTILLALIYGCGMMTKISCASVALVTALVFIVILIIAVKKQQWKDLIKKYIVFGMISLPLGLWYSIRNYILFKQPLNYVLQIPDDSVLYKGYKSIPQRIFVIKMSNLFADPYTSVGDDYNLPVYAIKSSLFGEFRFDSWGWISVLLLLFAFILSVFCVIAVAKCIRHSLNDKWCVLMLVSAFIFYGSVVVFYIKYPFGCSMDFRYMLFLPVPMAYILGKKGLFHEKCMGRYVDICCMGFMLTSCLIFC